MDGTDGAVVLINLFEVPPGADEGFVAGWEQARDFLQGQDGYLSTELHGSLAADAEFRFVNIARWRSPAAFQAAVSQPAFPGRELPFPSHPALYQIVREDPPPEGEPDGVVLINAFEVPPDGDDTFLAGWEQTRDVVRDLPGYLATRLHRSLSPGAGFRFVNVGRYLRPQAFQAAVPPPRLPARRRGHPVPGPPRPVRADPAVSRRTPVSRGRSPRRPWRRS